MSTDLLAKPTAEELEILRFVKANRAYPADKRDVVLRVRARGWIEAIYLEPSGHELTHVGQRVLAKERG